MKLAYKDYSVIRNWIYRNARPLELSIWNYYFENGSLDKVLDNLALYQNDDGGFGHALEADNWNANSSPATTMTAVSILRSLDYKDKNSEIIKGIVKYLDDNEYFNENGWFFSIPTNDEYAHAPWWTYDRNNTESIGCTLDAISFIFEYVDGDSNLYSRALKYCNRLMDKLFTNEDFGDMGIGGYCTLIENINQMPSIKAKYDYDKIVSTIKQKVNHSIEQDLNKWDSYSVRPSNYIRSRDSIFYENNKEHLQKELIYIINSRNNDGVWNITWSWFDNNEKYSKEFAISENWWKSSIAINNMLLLKEFNMIDNNYMMPN